MPKMKFYNGTSWVTLDANDADTVDGKHASDFAPVGHVGSGGTAHSIATTTVNGFMSSADKTYLESLKTHTHDSLKSTDDRDIKPSGTVKNYLSTFFTSKEGLTGVAGSDWQDLLVLNTYTDASGGSVNALAFDKSTKSIAHYQALQTDTTWGTPKTLAYQEDVNTSLAGKLDTTATAAAATKLATARSIALAGDVTGSVTFDGTANVSITATVADDSHNHIISNVDGLQTALDGKLSLAGGTMTGPVVITNTVDATVTGTGHALQIGPSTSENLVFDSNEIMARNNGVVSPLYLQNDGGEILIANQTGDGKLTVKGSTVISEDGKGVPLNNQIPAVFEGNLTFTHPTVGGYNSLVFKSAANPGSDYGYLAYFDDVSSFNTTYLSDASTENGALVLGVENDLGSNDPAATTSPADLMVIRPASRLIIDANAQAGTTQNSLGNILEIRKEGSLHAAFNVDGNLVFHKQEQSAKLAPEFTSVNTAKSRIQFSSSGYTSNDPGFIIHEIGISDASDTNKGVLHICPTDDNAGPATGSNADYVAIHGNDDPVTIKLYTDGTVVTPSYMQASSFNTSSTREVKDNITLFVEDALSMVDVTPVYNYQYKDELAAKGTAARVRTGLILEESPEHLSAEGGQSVDIYAMNATLWKAVQQLSQQVKDLQTKLANNGIA